MGGWSSVTCEAVGALPLVPGLPGDTEGLWDRDTTGKDR